MALMDSTRRERQRIAHLVFGKPRPKPPKASKRRSVHPDLLEPGIEEAVAQREAWAFRGKGTPETLAAADREAKRPGSLARLHRSGAIDAHQLAAAERIAHAHTLITAPVAVRTAKLEPRGTGTPDGAAREAMARIWIERDYDRWRARVGVHVAMLLAIIIDDMALTAAAKRYRHSVRSARAILIAGLDGWAR
jgi:hypothetical protein